MTRSVAGSAAAAADAIVSIALTCSGISGTDVAAARESGPFHTTNVGVEFIGVRWR